MDSVDDTDPGLAGLSPEFQAMLGGLAGHTASFAKILEKRTTSTEKDKDDEVYLESYADLAIHEEMLKDTERVDAYRRAIDQLGASWSNSTVVDVGAGTGVLSVMCGKRAKKVVAIEASRLSHFLRKVVATNAPNVEVHDARAEDLELTEKVDVVVSEWMGYCLLFENMLPSVLSVRDRYLKPGGMMLPSKCRLLLAPLEDQDWRKQKLDFWTSVHGIDMSSLIPLARATYCGTPQHHLVDASKLLADPQVIFEADLHTVLSMDNLVVFSLIMTTYRVPACLTRKALFVGIVGCVVMRLGFFLALENILKHEKILQVCMGIVLMASGGHAMFEDDNEGDVVDTYVVRATKACLGSRLEQRYDTETCRLFVYQDGKYRATLLVFVILLLEITDLMFALDSVSAKIAAVPNQFIAYSSTVMAVFSLRAAFFIVHDLVQQIEVLKYGVAFIVAYIGVQLILSTFRYVPEWSTCAVSGLVILTCLMARCCVPSKARSN